MNISPDRDEDVRARLYINENNNLRTKNSILTEQLRLANEKIRELQSESIRRIPGIKVEEVFGTEIDGGRIITTLSCGVNHAPENYIQEADGVIRESYIVDRIDIGDGASLVGSFRVEHHPV